jgi:hypothetical protein
LDALRHHQFYRVKVLEWSPGVWMDEDAARPPARSASLLVSLPYDALKVRSIAQASKRPRISYFSCSGFRNPVFFA